MKEFAVRMMHEEGSLIAEVHLYSAIGGNFEGGVSASDFVSSVKKLSDNVHIEMHYNSGGGSPYEAVAMATALAAHPGGYTAIVDGVCASSATIPFCVAKTRKMRKGAMLMIHEPSQPIDHGGMRSGDLRKVAGKLDAVTESAVSFYETATGKSRQSLLKMMSDETWLSPEEAKQEGFISEEIESEAVAASLDLSEFKNVPDSVMSLVEMKTIPSKPKPTLDKKETIVSENTNTPETKPESITMSVEDYEKLRDNQKPEVNEVEMATQDAVKQERERVANIHAVCMKSGIEPEAEKKFVDEGTTLDVVQMAAIDKMAITNKPPTDGDSSITDDKDASYKKEYQDAIKDGVKMQSSEEEYIHSRRVSDGKEALSEVI